jgi:RNA polymerase sigma-32 factor
MTFEAALMAPLMSREEEREALRAWQDAGDQQALRRILESFARQAWAEARRWTDNRTQLEDLAAEGMIGLIDAAGSFDLSMDVRFGTYSAWAVRNRIMAALTYVTAVIDVPARACVDARSGRPNARSRNDAVAAAAVAVSIDDISGAGGGMRAVQWEGPTPEEEVTLRSENKRVQALLYEALAALNPAEREAILHRLEERPAPEDDCPGSRSRRRDIERRAMFRLRRCLQERGFSLAMLEC